MKKLLSIFLSTILLTTLASCSANNNSSSKNSETMSSVKLGKGDATIVKTVSKKDFSKPIQFNYNNEKITVNTPVYTNIPVESVYIYKSTYKFDKQKTILNVAAQSGQRYFAIDKTGLIVDTNYEYPTDSDFSLDISSIGAVHALGDDMYAYTNGNKTSDDYEIIGIMDKNGTKITNPIFKDNLNYCCGYAVAQKLDGSYVGIDKMGKEYGKLPGGVIRGNKVAVVQTGKAGNYTQQLYSITGEALGNKYDSIGYFYNGLALTVKDNKVGFIDEKGNEVLKPVISYDKLDFTDKKVGYYPIYMNEDAFILPINGEFAVITIKR